MLFKYRVSFNIQAEPASLNFNEFIPPNRCLKDNTFIFLNLSKTFSQKVDWEFSEYGKLWTYNLNYFDYINQEDVELDRKIGLIKYFTANIEKNKTALEPFPTSLRCVNWIKFLSENKINDKEVYGALYAQYKILLNNLEYHLLGNHLLENAFSLLFGSYYFKDLKFYLKAKQILLTEINEQILPDGGHFELSPMYHQIILERMLDSINLIKNNQWLGSELIDLLSKKSSSMLGWLRQMSFKNGDTPLFNDSAFGVAPSTEELFQYAKQLGIKEDTKHLKESGYRKLAGKNYEIIIDIGNIGPDYIPGHAHCDTFSFVLYIDDEPFIVDTGTSTYEDSSIRFDEKSTSAHNTIQINGYEQSEIWGSFRVARRARIKNVKETGQVISAIHDGYKRIGALHERSYRFSDDIIIITDIIQSKSDYPCYSYLHFHPDIDISLEGSVISANDKRLIFENAEIFLTDYQYAQGFNRTTQAKLAVVKFKRILTTKIKTR